MTIPPAPQTSSPENGEQPHATIGRWPAIILKNWIANIGFVGAVVAAVWAIFQYYEHERETRVALALQYQRDLRTSPLFDSWRSVMIDSLADAASDLQAIGSNRKDFLSYSMSLGANNKSDLDVVMSFYNNIWACVQSHICDKDVSAELYGADASNLYTFYGVYISCEEASSADGLVNIRQAYWQLRRKSVHPFQATLGECEGALSTASEVSPGQGQSPKKQP